MSMLFLIKHLFSFDWKLHKTAILLPVFMFFILLVHISTASTASSLRVLQTAFLPWIAWTIILHLQPIFDEGARDTLLPHYRKWIFLDILRYTVVFLSMYIVLIGMILRHGDSLSPIVYIHHVSIFLFFLFFGMALIWLTKNFEFALSILLMYTLLEIVTKGQFMPWPHVFQFETFEFDPLFVSKIGTTFILAIFFMMMGLFQMYRR
ncbi:hypothetical protein ACV3PA_11345 [Exiguobacterium acetylicum]